MTLVFINSGHSYNGQPDPGACYNGYRECDVAALIGKSLATALLRYENVQTQVYQQYNDPAYIKQANFGKKNFQLNAVSKKANAVKANYFISIHLNASASSMAKGTEVLYNPKSTWGKVMAQCIQTELIKPIGTYTLADRKIKARDDLAVLNQTNMPACLIEVGFISNKAELDCILANVDAITNRIAIGLANACKFTKKTTATVSPEVKTAVANKYRLEPSNGKYNLYINDTLVLKENRYETCIAYMNSDAQKIGIITV